MPLYSFLLPLQIMFQYNFCYCSMYWRKLSLCRSFSFNTTFVTVLFRCPCCIIFPRKVSIQLLLLFYSLPQALPLSSASFNTTFVTVLFLPVFPLQIMQRGFNTTFVTVLYQRERRSESFLYVSIQLLLLFY